MSARHQIKSAPAVGQRKKKKNANLTARPLKNRRVNGSGQKATGMFLLHWKPLTSTTPFCAGNVLPTAVLMLSGCRHDLWLAFCVRHSNRGRHYTHRLSFSDTGNGRVHDIGQQVPLLLTKVDRSSLSSHRLVFGKISQTVPKRLASSHTLNTLVLHSTPLHIKRSIRRSLNSLHLLLARSVQYSTPPQGNEREPWSHRPILRATAEPPVG